MSNAGVDYHRRRSRVDVVDDSGRRVAAANRVHALLDRHHVARSPISRYFRQRGENFLTFRRSGIPIRFRRSAKPTMRNPRSADNGSRSSTPGSSSSTAARGQGALLRAGGVPALPGYAWPVAWNDPYGTWIGVCTGIGVAIGAAIHQLAWGLVVGVIAGVLIAFFRERRG